MEGGLLHHYYRPQARLIPLPFARPLRRGDLSAPAHLQARVASAPSLKIPHPPATEYLAAFPPA